MTIGHGGWFDDVFLFDHLPGGQWAALVAVLVGWVVAHRVLKHRRRREQLRRRRQIRARLHAPSPPVMTTSPPPVTLPPQPPVMTPPPGITPPPVKTPPPAVEIDLREPATQIDLRDRVVYGSEITLESGDTLESGIVGPD